MSRFVFAISLLAALLGAGALFAEPAAEEPKIVGDRAMAHLVLATLDAYHRLDTKSLAPRLGKDFRYLEKSLGKDLDGPAFLDFVIEEAKAFDGRELDVEWVGVMPPAKGVVGALTTVEARGRWRASHVKSGREMAMAFSMRLRLVPGAKGTESTDAGASETKIASWTSVFVRRRLHLPIRGGGQNLSEHFDIRYLRAEFDAEKAARLAALSEGWYRRTAEFLGRDFESGRRVLLDIASPHEIPYASAPGSEAFFLVSAKYAELDYGFSLVHELTHNLVGLSRLSQTSRDQYRGGNRLLDEGFGVYVEEKLVKEGRVFPNYGEETHRAYLDLHGRMKVPRPPILEAEALRARGGDETRLAYLQQSSFVKWLVETAPGPEATDGLGRFLKLFEQGLETLPELYGRDLGQLEREWLDFLAGFSVSDEPS